MAGSPGLVLLVVFSLGCGEEIPRVLQAASDAVRAGRLDRADSLLTRALERCPAHPDLLAELAGLRFRQDRPDEAEALADRLVRVDPDSRYGWQLLGTLRYLDDDPSGALRAWSRGRPPVARSVEISVQGPGSASLDRAEVTRVAGIAPGEPLTLGDLVRGSRRLEALPAAARARLGYRMQPDGEAHVEGAVVLRPRSPFSRTAWVAHGLRALRGQVHVRSADLLGHSELWEFSGAMEGSVLEATAALARPAPGGGLLGGSGTRRWEVQHRSSRYGNPVLGPDSEGDPAAVRIVREEGTRVRWSHAHWLTATFWGRAEAGLDRRPRRGTFAGGGISVSLVPLSPRWSVQARAEGWTRVAGTSSEPFAEGEGRRFGRFELEGLLHSFGTTSTGMLPGLHARGGLVGVSRGAPLDLAPRIGNGRNVQLPMRAGSDLDGEGVVRPLFPGTTWVHAGVEVGRRVAMLGPVAVGFAVFGDGVRALGHARSEVPDEPARGGIHLGAGVRLGVPGIDGRFRLDWAVDPSNGVSAVSAAWTPRPDPVR